MAQPYEGPSTATFGNAFSATCMSAPERARCVVLPPAKVDPSRFQSTVTWSNYMRYCQHDGCNRVMGRNGKSYSYSSAISGETRRDVCSRCHRKLQRPSLKAWRAKFYDEKERASEKQLVRDRDAERLANSEVTLEELRKENAFFTFSDLKIRDFGGSPKKR